jgi:hypothetical protein
MGYTTDLIGHIQVDPPLNRQEQDFLHFFTESRRHRAAHRGLRGHNDRYPHNDHYSLSHAAVPAHPIPARPIPARPIPGAGRPARWCQWVSGCDGQCITHNGSEWFYAPTAWLRYIIDHFLRAPAALQTGGGGQFDAFTFDHVCNGVVAGCRRGSSRPFLIRVTNNEVTQEALFDGPPDREMWPPFGYESELDRRRALRPQRAGRGSAYPSSVIPFGPVAKADRE